MSCSIALERRKALPALGKLRSSLTGKAQCAKNTHEVSVGDLLWLLGRIDPFDGKTRRVSKIPYLVSHFQGCLSR